ncbi:unnamed protein product [Arabidopsis halleri]
MFAIFQFLHRCFIIKKPQQPLFHSQKKLSFFPPSDLLSSHCSIFLIHFFKPHANSNQIFKRDKKRSSQK